ncbi:probable protein phosphatase 2C T23F11.1 isoform X2 [Cimex lectularius]|nr:probable protein phosphatase 2C T23F11.1 isoform X2 [Cimex lectularius]XP_014259571.1 probable protein phosphatase 2C T23F11.1 isoform X2 [Cimex lectularius]
MGQSLSEPVTTKCSLICKNEQVKVGLSSMQGWRVSMEDSHTLLLEVPQDPSASFYAIFDGHGGSKISEYASRHLYKWIFNQKAYQEGDIVQAIENGYLELDAFMRENKVLRDDLAGSTAVVVLIKGNTLYCGNAGDSRAIAVVNGTVRPLSHDHKPTEPAEYARIKEAGGWVEYNRVNGNLALSRALGDYMFKTNSKKSPKEQVVTAFPEVIVEEIDESWEFIVLACDGIWDVMSNEEVAGFIRDRLMRQLHPDVICEELMMTCLAPDSQMGGYGCDNMTVTIIVFQNTKVQNLENVALEKHLLL